MSATACGAQTALNSDATDSSGGCTAGGEQWTIYATGHSMGGALATLFAYEVAQHDFKKAQSPNAVCLARVLQQDPTARLFFIAVTTQGYWACRRSLQGYERSQLAVHVLQRLMLSRRRVVGRMV